MKNLLLITGLILVNFTLRSQTTYDKVIREQNQTGILANATFRNAQGELIISGNFKQGQSHVSKLDSLGNPIWTREFIHTDQNTTGYQFAQKDHLIQLQDSTYLLTRNCYNTGNNNNLSILICFSENGTLNWSRRIHQNESSNEVFSKTIETNAGKLLHVFSVLGSQGIQVSRLSSSGVMEITNAFTISSVLKPEGFVKMNNEAVIVCTDNTNTFFIKIDENGNFIQNRKLNNFLPEDVVISDSTLYVLGFNTNYYPFVACIDSSLNQATYYSNYLSERKKIKVINDKVYILSPQPFAGGLERINLSSMTADYTYYSSQIMDIYELNPTHLLSISNGPMWGIKKAFGEPQIGVGVSDLTSQNNNCISTPAAVQNPTVTFDTLDQISILIATNSNNSSDSVNILWTTGTITTENGCVDHLGALDENSLDKLDVYPNPSDEQFQIQAKERFHWVEIRDLTGSLINRIPANDSKCVISTKDFLNGFYIVSAVFDNGTMAVAKILVQH